jgi:hypothetical protein
MSRRCRWTASSGSASIWTAACYDGAKPADELFLDLPATDAQTAALRKADWFPSHSPLTAPVHCVDPRDLLLVLSAIVPVPLDRPLAV